ncbi:hypothetical protein [Enterococcus gallinarum]|uniref:hypothetical protein n=1 Tax=Enterococcus gallinarum TaxID=1353 RepID=UPI001D1740D6|nr:hypothetical protein [Enterococcus gallinarum]MCC4045649.1 hypothetical protein [Enterococcus gallinarum]
MNYVDRLTHLTFFEKELKRISIFTEKNISFDHGPKKFIKPLNSEIIAKEKLEKDRKRRWVWL